MPLVRTLLSQLNKYDLDDTIAWAIFDKEDVKQAIKELNEFDGETYPEITDEEVKYILDSLYADPERGMNIQDIIDAYYDLLDRKESEHE